MKNEIVGRVREKRTLEKLRRSKDPELLALYGRRRVGKTFLIRKYFGEEETYFELTGVVFYIESRRFLIRDSPRPATTYEQKTGGADGVKGA